MEALLNLASEDFLILIALATLIISSVAAFAGIVWAIPAAIRDRRAVDPADKGMAIFASYQLLVAVLSTLALLCFVATASLVLTFDLIAVPRILGTRLLVFAVAVSLSVMVVGGPIARRRANLSEAARIREEQEGLRQRMDRTEAKQDKDLVISEETREMMMDLRAEQHTVRGELGTEQNKVRDALGEQQRHVRDDLDTQQERVRGELSDQRDKVRETKEKREREQDARREEGKNV